MKPCTTKCMDFELSAILPVVYPAAIAIEPNPASFKKFLRDIIFFLNVNSLFISHAELVSAYFKLTEIPKQVRDDCTQIIPAKPINASARIPATISVIGAPRNGFGTSARSSSSLIPAIITKASVNPAPAPKPNITLSIKL